MVISFRSLPEKAKLSTPYRPGSNPRTESFPGVSVFYAPPVDYSRLAAIIHQGCVAIARENGPLRLDAAALAASKTAGLSALLAWKRFAQTRRRPVTIENLPARLRQLITVYQVADLF